MKGATIVIAALALARSVAAQPAGTPAAGAQAEVLFRDGKQLMKNGRYADACAAFDASEKLDPTAATVLNQADCREKNGQLATAWGLFLEAERATRGKPDESSMQMHNVAVDHAAKLEPRLSTLTIAVPDDSKVGGLEIVRGSEVVDSAEWNKTLPVDGGTYRVTARAPGNSEWSTMITIAGERDAKAIEIPRLKSAELGKPMTAAAAVEAKPSTDLHKPTTNATTAAPATERDQAEPDVPPAQQRPVHWLPLGIGGGAVVLVAGALGLELAGESTYNRAKVALDPPTQVALWHTANGERYAAEALALGGATAAGVAVWLYVRGRHAEREVAVVPLIGGDRAGIQLVGGF